MPDFTAFDPASRLILYSGSCEVPEMLPHSVFVGVRADGSSHRVREDLNAIEPKPALSVSFSATTIPAGGSVEVHCAEVSRVSVDGVEVAASVSEVVVVEFPDPGTYTVLLEPLSQLSLPHSETITAT